MKSNLIKVVFVVVFAMVAGYEVHFSQQDIEMSNLALENIEALAGGEVATSWNCTGYWGNCYAYCGRCGTKVDSDGELTGRHSCN